MELIKKLGTRLSKSGYLESWGLFLCPYCLQEVEMRLNSGKKAKTCKKCVKTKHGGYYTKIYKIYKGIKDRCYNKNIINYKYYGGRGITICPEWTDIDNGFINFRNWSLNNGYTDNLTIDRINNNGNYESNNCRFVTNTENQRNRRNNVLTLKIANEIRTLYNSGYYTQKKLGEKYNLNQTKISKIITNKIWKNNE